MLPAAVFLTGASVLVVEVTAVRVLSPYYGNTIFTVSSVISIILLALSAGYYAGGILADRRPSLRAFFAIIAASGSPVKLYFDEETGLLVRQVRFTEASLGRNMLQVDYDDYRDVAGVKIPFKWTVSWLSGRSVFELSNVQPNVAIDAAKFARPAPARR